MDSSLVLVASGLGTIGALIMALANWPGYLKPDDRKMYNVLMLLGISLVFLGFMVGAGDWLHRNYGCEGLRQLAAVILANVVVGVIAIVILRRLRKRKAG